MQCDLHKGGFDTANEFSDFQKLIEKLVQSKKIIKLGRKADAWFFEVRCQCSLCDRKWVLAFPDQAYRGDWREE